MFSLYGYEAAAEEIELEHVEVIPRDNVGMENYLSKFPLSRGKIPGLVGPSIEITETIAITTYLSKLSNKRKLLGDGSLEQEATVISWMSWANQELLTTLATWYLHPSLLFLNAQTIYAPSRFLPLIPNWTRPAPYNKAAVEAGKVNSLQMLQSLEEVAKDRDYLVGNGMTLADIFVAVVLLRGLEWVLGDEWQQNHPAIMRYVRAMTDWQPVKTVIPHFKLIEEEPPNQNPYR